MNLFEINAQIMNCVDTETGEIVDIDKLMCEHESSSFECQSDLAQPRQRSTEGGKRMLEVCPMTLKEANAFVEQYHRHHGPVVGHKFSIGCSDG